MTKFVVELTELVGKAMQVASAICSLIFAIMAAMQEMGAFNANVPTHKLALMVAVFGFPVLASQVIKPPHRR